MPLYHWSSEALADYLDGDIIVMASNANEARKKVLAEVRRRYPNAHPDALKERLLDFEKDMLEEPSIADVFLINGSS